MTVGVSSKNQDLSKSNYCVFCGKKRGIFEKFNKYGFCASCNVRTRGSIESIKSTIAHGYQIFTSHSVAPGDENKALNQVLSLLNLLDEVENIRKKVPFFTTQFDTEKDFFIQLKNQLHERLSIDVLHDNFSTQNTSRLVVQSDELDNIKKFDIAISNNPIKNQTLSQLTEIKYSNITAKGKYDEFVVIDTETTGLSASKDKIVELSAIRFLNGAPVQIFDTLINPGKPIPEEAAKINHITNEMVTDAPSIKEVIESFDIFVGKSNVVGHNLDFDLKFIHRSGSKLLDEKRKYFCTLKISQRHLKSPKRKWDKELQSYEKDYDDDYDVYDHKLDTLCQYYGIEVVGKHRSSYDALATGKLFLSLVSDIQ